MTPLSLTAQRYFLQWIQTPTLATDIEQIRPYQAGDPKNKIHWKQSVKQDQWQVRSESNHEESWRIFIDNRKNMQFGYPKTKASLGLELSELLKNIAGTQNILTDIIFITNEGIKRENTLEISSTHLLKNKKQRHFLISDFYQLLPIKELFLGQINTLIFNLSDPIEWGKITQYSNVFIKNTQTQSWLNLKSPKNRENCKKNKENHVNEFLFHAQNHSVCFLSTETELTQQINDKFLTSSKPHVA